MAGVAMAVCCSVHLLVIAGILGAGAGGALRSPLAGLALALVASGVVLGYAMHRRRTRAACCAPESDSGTPSPHRSLGQ